MSAFLFKKATKFESRLRFAIVGVSGSGKSYTSLAIATGLGGKVAAVDTEKGSLSKYADLFSFDVLELSSFHPQTYIDAIQVAENAGFDVLIIDSLSHAWMGKDGALELVDKAAKRNQGGNSFSAWRDVTPLHTALIDAILGSKMHIIATMRSKTEYVLETGRNGKMTPRKVGMAAVQRDGMEYEFDVVGEINQEHELVITKTRCSALTDGIFAKPGKEIADLLNDWLKGEKLPEPQQQPPAKLHALPPPSPHAADNCEAIGKESAPQLSIKEIAQRLVDINAVTRTPDGYTVTTGEGTRLIQKIEGKVGCNCNQFIDSTDPDFQCEHIHAVAMYAKRQQELDAKAAQESA
jgi:hypothetical protein